MNVLILPSADTDLALTRSYYNAQRRGLGDEFVNEFREGIDKIILLPNGWQPIDSTFRRFRLSRFPYGIIYRPPVTTQTIVVVAIMHLHRHPDSWRDR